MSWVTVLQGGVLVLFLGLGGLFPRVPQGFVTRSTVLNVVTGGFLFALRLAVVMIVGGVESHGVIAMGWASAPAVQFLVAFLLLDFARYAIHYADHRVSWLWFFHRVHHSSEELDATSGLRMHAVDLLQLTAIPLVLFSLLLDTRGFEAWVIPSAMAVGVVFDAFQHANIRMDMTRPLNRLLNKCVNNPHFHCWHHTRDGVLRDGNYANVLLVWDHLFGTVVTQPEVPEAYGLPESQRLSQSVVDLQLLRSA